MASGSMPIPTMMSLCSYFLLATMAVARSVALPSTSGLEELGTVRRLALSTLSNEMTPDFEVKLLINASTVIHPSATSKPTLTDTFLAAFGLTAGSPPIDMGVQFLDTDEVEEIYCAGWSPRIRRLSDSPKKIELTYKKRFEVPLPEPAPGNGIGAYNADPGTDVGVLQTAIDQVLALAASKGFDSALEAQQGFEAQVEWGYAKLTLSISQKIKVRAADWGLKSGVEMPDQDKSRQMLVANAPAIFKSDVGGLGAEEKLGRSRIYGAVHAERWEGKWAQGPDEQDFDVDIEIWPIKKAKGGDEMENLVEISFKVGDAKTAQEKQAKLMELLRAGGWFAEGDSLKTALIMQRY